MKVPDSIKIAIFQAAIHAKLAISNSNRVRDWLYENNLANDANIDVFIDSCESGTNEPEAFMAWLAGPHVEEGNDSSYAFLHDK